MTVRQNVAFGLRMKGMAKVRIAEKVDRLLAVVQLPPEAFGDRAPSALSGGQLQRVALARTLVTEPALVLFDEPMAALDKRLRDYMAVELRSIQKRLGIAAVYVTHDQETASAMSDRSSRSRSCSFCPSRPEASRRTGPACRGAVLDESSWIVSCLTYSPSARSHCVTGW